MHTNLEPSLVRIPTLKEQFFAKKRKEDNLLEIL
jgi:hypothetical protein